MKILYIASNRFPTEKAHGYQIGKMCEAFSRQNQVLLLYPRKKNTKELKKVKDIHKYYSIQGIFSTKSLFCLDLTLLKKVRIPKLWFLTSSLSYALSTFFWVIFHKKKFDVIYSRAPFSLFLLSFLRRIIGVRMIYESHTFPASEKSFRLNLAKKVDKLVVVTKKTKELYIKAGVKEDHIIVEPSAVDMSQFDISIGMKGARKKLNIPVNIILAS
ncbi:MAG: glycosyltransferase, partial [Candidatus Aminicenantes bacterium]|nr:glycosyltransferase [Candidatus Aminicenantes bacterium]